MPMCPLIEKAISASTARIAAPTAIPVTNAAISLVPGKNRASRSKMDSDRGAPAGWCSW